MASQPPSPVFVPDTARINRGIAQFVRELRKDFADESSYAQDALEGYLAVLERGGKRLRGALTLCGYELYGGTDMHMATKVAGIVETLHAYLLVIDDVADNADTRRGGPSAHIHIETGLRKTPASHDIQRKSMDLAIMTALYVQHKAQSALCTLPVTSERKLEALGRMNEYLARTGIGQMLDLISATKVPMPEEDILKIARYKTAYYTFLLPLEIGAILAGAPEKELKLIRSYALFAGVAFQLRDDILGVFGDEKSMGKSAKSDIMEGKQTLLIYYALEGGTKDERALILESLGNERLTNKAFKGCKDVMIRTAALRKVEDLATDYVDRAHEIMDNCPKRWPPEYVQYLRDIASFGAVRIH